MSIVHTGLESLHRAETNVERAARKLAELPVSVTGEPQDIVEISAVAVSLLEARHHAEASLRVIETGQRLEKAAIDLLG